MDVGGLVLVDFHQNLLHWLGVALARHQQITETIDVDFLDFTDDRLQLVGEVAHQLDGNFLLVDLSFALNIGFGQPPFCFVHTNLDLLLLFVQWPCILHLLLEAGIILLLDDV